MVWSRARRSRAKPTRPSLLSEPSSRSLLGTVSGDGHLEATENYLDLDSQLDSLSADGVFIPVELPDAKARVEETRTESTLNVSKRLNEQLTLQATVGAEYSEIRQTGSSNVTRDFVRPKGFVALNYKPTDDLFLSAKLERAVGQLRFFDFIASVDVNQEREDVTNVNLVPPQSWDFTLEAQRSLGKSGNLTLSLFYEDVEDIVDRIPIEGRRSSTREYRQRLCLWWLFRCDITQ